MSARPLTLKTYLALNRGADAVPPLAVEAARPAGRLIWACVASAEQAQALRGFASRLKALRPDTSVMIVQSGRDAPDLPDDSQRAADAYARALRPDVVLWGDRFLRPALIDAFARQGALLVALDAQDAIFETPAPRWLPDPSPATLGLFHTLYAVSQQAQRRLRRLGVSGSRVHVAGAFMDAGPPLECSEALHTEVSDTLKGRPVWLAAQVRAAEVSDVLRAHRLATRWAHRVLLVIAAATSEDEPAIRAALKDSDMRCQCWEDGDLPEEATQIVFAGDGSELGLWYRVAPLAFLGSSLVTGHGGTDPFQAATLGTAILYGPNVGKHLNAYTQLVEAGAARIVRDADSLAAAVQHLTAPDQSAAMAHAGWDVVSSGAQLVDTLMTQIGDWLDEHAPQDMSKGAV